MSLKNSPTSKSAKIKVGITLGDPSGIGRLIIPAAIKKLKNLAHFVVIGDASAPGFRAGRISPASGKASLEYLDKALELLRNKEIDCLVTCPVSKEAINQAGVSFSGHTEYLAKQANIDDFVMMLLNKRLKFSLLTRHIPIKDISAALSADKIYKTVSLTLGALKQMFRIANPRIAVCGLNPHASDNGVIGDEENKIIRPALERLRKDFSAQIIGPLSSDVAISKAYNGEYDCLMAIYHDQAMIPLKLTDFNSGVNLTLGLPYVRTSPLHGTAFDILRTPQRANPASLIAAIKLAVKCTTNLKKD